MLFDKQFGALKLPAWLIVTIVVITLSSKNSSNLIDLLDLLGARYAIRILWALRDGKPQSFRQLQSSLGRATANTVNARVKDLRKANLLAHDGHGYCVTPMGAQLLNQMAGLEYFAHTSRIIKPSQNESL